MDPTIKDDAEQTEHTAALFRLLLGKQQRPPANFDKRALERSTSMMLAAGQVLGEETLMIADGITDFGSNPALAAGQASVTCPGRKRIDHGREGHPGVYEEGPDVTLKVGALRIGDIALGYANAEIYTEIGQQVRDRSPVRKTIFVSLTNGQSNSGYVPTDEAFSRTTFEVVSSSLKSGCAEQKIVNEVVRVIQNENSAH
jgi:neutral ceramidase